MLHAGSVYVAIDELRVPKDIPVKQFCSLTVYDRASWTPEPAAGRV
jgi:hypothetical protein